MIKAVVLDLNGVFLKSELLTERLEDHYGIPSNESLAVLKESMKIVRLHSTIQVFTYWKVLFKKYDIDITEDQFLEFWFTGESLVPEIVEISKDLRKRGLKVYIFSNNFKERTEYYRKNFKEIFDSVDDAFFSWETGYVKSEKRAYENLLEMIHLEPSEVIYFDDSEENIEIANQLGIEGYVYENANQIKEIVNEKVN